MLCCHWTAVLRAQETINHAVDLGYNVWTGTCTSGFSESHRWSQGYGFSRVLQHYLVGSVLLAVPTYFVIDYQRSSSVVAKQVPNLRLRSHCSRTFALQGIHIDTSIRTNHMPGDDGLL